MTDAERQRLDELLLEDDLNNKNNANSQAGEIDNKLQQQQAVANGVVDGSVDGGESNNTILVEYNPGKVSLANGDGFMHESRVADRLKEIDTRLEKRNYSRLSSSRNTEFSYISNKFKFSTASSDVDLNMLRVSFYVIETKRRLKKWH